MGAPSSRPSRRPKVVLAAPFFVTTLAFSLLIVTMASSRQPDDLPPIDVKMSERKERADEIIKAIEARGKALADQAKKQPKAPSEPKPPPGPATVTPTFKWPQDLKMEVDYSKLVRMRGRYIPVERMRFGFDAPVQKDGTRVLRTSDLIRLKPSGEILSKDGAQHLIKQQGLGELLAPASISAAGKVLAPNTAPALLERAREILFGSATPAPSLETKRVSEALVGYKTSMLWDTLVGGWASGTWKKGEARVLEFETLAPAIGLLDKKIAHRAKFVYEGSAWCNPVKREKACAKFVMVLSPSPIAAAEAMKAALDAAEEGATSVVDKIELSERHTLVTDPATLIPERHSIDTLLRFTATISLPGKPGQPQTTLAETRVERVYRVDKALTNP